MKTLNLILVTLLFGVTLQIDSAMCQSNLQKFVDNYFDKRDQFESLTAEVHFMNKLFSKDDTLRTTALIEVVSDPTDTLFSGYLFMQTETKAYAYDGETAFFGDVPLSTLTINERIKNPGQAYIDDWARNFIETSFLTKNQSGRSMLSNSDFESTVSDTMIGQWPCKGIHMIFPDQEEFTDLTIFAAIDTVDLMLRHRSISMMFQENEQYQSWTYSNPVYGHQKKLTKLNDDFLASFKHQELYEYITSDSTAEAKIKIDYSALQGRIMGTEEPFDIKDIDAEIIVLDFWYSACYPCIKSIPEVNKIYDLFNDRKVAVFGVNIIDDELKNRSRIEKYVRNNPMLYQTIMADRNTFYKWVPNGYPMLLILDSDHQLIEAHTGFTEGMAEGIAEVVEEHLND